MPETIKKLNSSLIKVSQGDESTGKKSSTGLQYVKNLGCSEA